ELLPGGLPRGRGDPEEDGDGDEQEAGGDEERPEEAGHGGEAGAEAEEGEERRDQSGGDGQVEPVLHRRLHQLLLDRHGEPTTKPKQAEASSSCRSEERQDSLLLPNLCFLVLSLSLSRSLAPSGRERKACTSRSVSPKYPLHLRDLHSHQSLKKPS
ncbi:unnamed protein product, partial [Musa acuminata subsp. burmannicoides]